MELTKYSNSNEPIDYDTTRIPIALNLIEKYINLLPTKNTKSIMEIGVGTGSYFNCVDKLVKNFQLTAIDRSQEMLNRCLGKFTDSKWDISSEQFNTVSKNLNSIQFIKHEIGEVFNHNGKYNLIYCCQVLHHLGGEDGTHKLFSTVDHVSRKGSYFIVNWLPPEQLLSYWYLSLFPSQIIENFVNKTVDINHLVKIAYLHGWEFVEVQIHNGKEETLQDYQKYKQPKSVLTSEFRVGDSCWSMCSDEELDIFNHYIEKQSEEELQKLFTMTDVHRLAFGQATSIVFIKKD